MEQDIGRTEVARALGHDLYRWRCVDQDGTNAAVAEGYAQAASRRLPQRTVDRYVRKWLQLRAGALRRDRIVNDDVTPELLRVIDVERCPVTRVVLTHAELKDSDWSVDRLNNDGAYAANNVAVMSTRANLAKGTKGYDHVMALSKRAGNSDGLAPIEWLRLATLMLGPCFATRPAEAPIAPLVAPLPNRSAVPVVQHIQDLFTRMARMQAGKNALIKAFKSAEPSERSVARLRIFAEAMHQGLKRVEERHDVWLETGVLDAFIAWRQTLDDRGLGIAGEISRQWAKSRVVQARTVDAWHLASRGHFR